MRIGTLLSALTVLTVVPVAAQQPDWEARRLYATRADLEELLRRFELAAASPAYSARTRAEASADARRIRQRLDMGDFQTGDRIYLEIEGEEALTDTFTVAPGPQLTLPMLGNTRLQGVLRAELEAHLTEQISRFIREPVLRVRTLIRVSIIGEVSAPGFYVVPTEGLLTDALMRAGGPTRDASLDDIRVERESEVIWGDQTLQQAIIEGRTLDQMNLRAGDRIVVPEQSSGLAGAEGALRTIGILLSIPLSVFALTQLF